MRFNQTVSDNLTKKPLPGPSEEQTITHNRSWVHTQFERDINTMNAAQ